MSQEVDQMRGNEIGRALVTQHTCASGPRVSCAPCMDVEVALWDAINRYATSVGGDPGSHVHDNTPRMQAVVDVNKIVGRVTKPIIQTAEDPALSGYSHASATIKRWTVYVDRRQLVDARGRPRRFSTERAAIAAARRSAA